jgi:L-ascorbate metabolism protein UlaG (beta-lactamase superfamily)
MNELYRFSRSTVVEPLVNRWSACSPCIAPLTASLYANHYQLPNLRQYLESPQVAVEACRNPKYRAGRFVNIPPHRAQEVKAFVEQTEKEYADSIRLAREMLRFQVLLNTQAAAGLPLAPLYGKLPDELRGYVELLYDYFTRPMLRVSEPLLYESRHYRPHLQSFQLFPLASDASRELIFSTPRLPSPQAVDWPVPFNDPRVDELFRLDAQPRPLAHIRELLGLRAADDGLLAQLVQACPAALPAAPPAPPPEGAVRIRHFGHACVLVEWQGVSILVDPCFGCVPHEPAPAAGGAARLSYEDLPAHIDFALVTHNHHDHYSLETLLRIRHKLGCLVVPRAHGLHHGDISLKLLSRRIGFRNVVELDTLESIPLPGGRIVGVPFLGEHSDLPHAKTAYVVEAHGQRMLFAADSDCLDARLYQHLADALGPVQTVFLGLECVGAPMTWSCGALFAIKPTLQQDQQRRQHGCDAERGLKMLQALKAQRLYVYAMGLEPWYEWLLGLAYTDDAPQIREMRQILVQARQAGLREARLLASPCTLVLEAAGEAPPVTSPRPA